MSEQSIPLSNPDISQLEIDLVVQTMQSGRLSIGPMQDRFEQMMAARTDRLHAVAVNSGTSGLHLAMQALNVGPGDEVITTPFSFIASANCTLFVGAKPVFVDICPKTLNMDPQKLEAAITPRTKAIVAVECFGNPAYMDQYEAIAARHEIALIEDCCEALGSSIKGRPAGSFGRVGIFGFYPNKQITTGEGGMIVTNDKRVADLCRSMRSQGRPVVDPGATAGGLGAWLQHERLGYNYRLPEINAAIGVAQLRRFEEMMRRREEVARLYLSKLMDHHQLILPTIQPESIMSWFVFVVRLSATYTREERDRIIAGMRRHDIGAADYFPCIHLQPFYREKFGFKPGDFPIAESVSQRTIALPFYNSMTPRDVDMVCQTLDLMLNRENIKRS